jgi:HAD superfamily hydrolase (TIGR01484 family)
MTDSILLACDLDGTVLPNDPHIALAPHAMEQFAQFAKLPNVTLAYLSGRSLDHALAGIRSCNAPLPVWYAGDVGTTIYRKRGENFIQDFEWSKTFSADWGSVRAADIAATLSNMPDLRPQESDRQREFKVSYYFEPEQEEGIVARVRELISKLRISCEVVTLLEPSTNTGYLDITPEGATKRQALEYIRSAMAIDHNYVLYAGDAGNDLEPLTAGYMSVVVKNASDAFRKRVRTVAMEKGVADLIYFAHSDSGNYVGGILEAISHFNLV